MARRKSSMKDSGPVVNEVQAMSKLQPGSEAWVFNEAVENILRSRMDVLSKYLDPRRDIDVECGYPDTSLLDAKAYRDIYDRDPIAARVVEVMPFECWQVQPSVYEDEDADVVTPFEERWDAVSKKLRGQSWYEDEAGSAIMEMLKRADVAAGIGHFGGILLGLNDGEEDLSRIARGINEKGEMIGVTPMIPLSYNEADGSIVQGSGEVSQELIFMRVFDESLIQITRYETEKRNPRYGQPTEYMLTLADPADTHSGTGLQEASVKVHWSRFIHLADGLGSSEIFGAPRMRAVFNRLHDLSKLYGGSAEMYWRGAFPGLSIETHPQLAGDAPAIEWTEEQKTAMKAQMTGYFDKLQRYLALIGMSAKSLAPQVVDPTQQIEVQLTAICIKIATPKRIFMGSERGELSSGQDDDTWKGRLKERRKSHLTPRVVCPLVDRLIMLRVLPIPPLGYHVDWEDELAIPPLEQAQILSHRTDALVKYLSGGGTDGMAPIDFLTREMKFTDEEAEVILQNTLDFLAQANPEVDPSEIVPGKAPVDPMQQAMDAALLDQAQNPLPPGNGKSTAKPPKRPASATKK